MAKRLVLAAFLAVVVACKSGGKSGGPESSMPGKKSGSVSAAMPGHDATENALLSLGLDGRVARLDLNTATWKQGRVVVSQMHLMSEVLLLESKGEKKMPPHVHAVLRAGLEPRWVSELSEPTLFAVGENDDTLLLVSEHYLHALETHTGRRAFTFTTGELSGLRRPSLLLPFTPTGGAAAQSDTVYLPSFGSPENNKTVESFSLVTGERGRGWRTRGDIFSRAIVGGDRGDPKLYVVTDTGIVTCLDAFNYGYEPRLRWEHALEGRVGHGIESFLTPDGKGSVGGLFIVDNEGVVYCLDRITGSRRWVNATSRRPVAGPQVHGDLCVVKMKSGLIGFDASNLVYTLTATNGPDAGKTFWVRPGKSVTLGSGGKADLSVADKAVGASHMTLEFQGEVLWAACKGQKNRMSLNGGAATARGMLLHGSTVKVGETLFAVASRGSEPLWVDLPYDRIIAKAGDRMIAAKGMNLTLLNAWTGEVVGPTVALTGARMVATNTADGNVFAVGGDAVVYALFVR